MNTEDRSTASPSPQERARDITALRLTIITGENQWGGVGDLGGTTVHAAVANAICTATGVRVRRLPLKNFDQATFARA